MKKGMLIILIVTIFTIGSSYRFIQLNRNISNDKKYEKVKKIEYEKINHKYIKEYLNS